MVSEKRFDMKKLIEKLEAFLEFGGIKKDVTLLALSGVAVICSLCGVRLGGLLEELTVAKARAGIEKPLHLMPQTARVVSGGEEKIIPAEEVRAGDILCVLPGESIPVDGVIISGQTSINQAVMTGESLPERETFQMVPGQGVCALVGGHTVLAGNPALLEGHGVSLLPMQAAEQAISTGSTVTYAAVDGRRGFCAGLAFLLVLRVYLKTPNAPGQRVFSRCAAPFFLEIRQYSCGKMSCAT